MRARSDQITTRIFKVLGKDFPAGGSFRENKLVEEDPLDPLSLSPPKSFLLPSRTKLFLIGGGDGGGGRTRRMRKTAITMTTRRGRVHLLQRELINVLKMAKKKVHDVENLNTALWTLWLRFEAMWGIAGQVSQPHDLG